ncbi:FUSC family protein [Roseateles amylovorans]|uniref:FUSC family protein n=1 Tax=Roseateles amylovorans TaxID=2978473 RepID=A0ABY6B246_9BURK|nr:FUSC family protein [Roseateles amylovorans]UXH79254.1 FUSC family protein [Roseateles amylovorans]
MTSATLSKVQRIAPTPGAPDADRVPSAPGGDRSSADGGSPRSGGWRGWRHWPAHWWNGFSVALGVMLVQVLVSTLAPAPLAHIASQLAMACAICASLADLPGSVTRNFKRVMLGGALSLLAVVAVALLRPYHGLMGTLIAVLAFGCALMMSWGLRAAAVSFAPVLAMVFALAWPPQPLAVVVASGSAGILIYLAWSVFSGRLLQRRFRRLALAEALQGLARLLTARAELLGSGGGAQAMRDWLGNEAQLADLLQTARDQLFPHATEDPRSTAVLLHVIELRDLILASRLDLELIGEDPVGQRLRVVLVDRLKALATGLDRCRQALLDERDPVPPSLPPIDWQVLPPQDPRGRLQLLLQDRLRHLDDEVLAIARALDPSHPLPALPLDELQLRQFIAPEGWPGALLQAQLHLDSPVLRHALRSALALSSAYFIALMLPWASHPHWLVLSVAVVLRGSLDQTLERRNLRVVGTAVGCGLMLVLSQVNNLLVWTIVLQVAVGIAHAFATRRYLITAIAATMMALLQAHLADTSHGLAITERLADTVLGAALAWGFSYVLPAWERRNLPRSLKRARAALQQYVKQAMSAEMTPAGALAQRMARRQAYDALAALSAALQRSAAEPRRVRPPLEELNTVLDHGYRLMAHLSMMRQSLMRRAQDLDPDTVATLPAQSDRLQRALAGEEPVPPALQALQDWSLLPDVGPLDDLRPWIRRRMLVSVDDAARAGQAAERALAMIEQGRR